MVESFDQPVCLGMICGGVAFLCSHHSTQFLHQVGKKDRSTIREQLGGNSMLTDDLLHKQPGYGLGRLVRNCKCLWPLCEVVPEHYSLSVALAREGSCRTSTPTQSNVPPTGTGVKRGFTGHRTFLLAHVRQPLVQCAISLLIPGPVVI